MSQFSYILPSGAEFVVRGPAGATQDQADKIFYEQVAAGALVGYEPGQTLTSAATRVTKFELSRLDRGTAGIDNNPVLAINQGRATGFGITGITGIAEALAFAGISTGIAGTQTQLVLSVIQALPIPVSIPNLNNIPLTNPIDEADIVLI